MLYELVGLHGYDIEAEDGVVGRVSDFYFDDHQWVVRYLVVDTGTLFGRKVLIAPEAIEEISYQSQRIALSLSEQEIEEGPPISAALPVSRQNELELRHHYGWPKYWDASPSNLAGMPLVPILHPRSEEDAIADKPEVQKAARDGDPHLRSAREVRHYRIDATDGELGQIDGLIVDQADWQVRGLVVKTGGWLSSRKVVIPTDWAAGISWADREVKLSVKQQKIRDAREYDPAALKQEGSDVTVDERHARDWV